MELKKESPDSFSPNGQGNTSIMQNEDTKKSVKYRKSDAVKLLEILADEAARNRYPNVPYLAPRVYRDKTTNERIKCVSDFLKLKGHRCKRTDTALRVIDNSKHVTDVLGNSRLIGNIQRVYGSGAKSLYHLKAVIAGKSVSIEIKCGATVDNQNQPYSAYRAEVEKSGGIYVFVTDFESFLSWYKNFAL
jgi:hypothetical protein